MYHRWVQLSLKDDFMKIAFSGLALPEGKHKYKDEIFLALVEKFQPAKVTPYYFEFLKDRYERADIIAVSQKRILDVLILDMEKIENRLSRTEDPFERSVLEKCLAHIEEQRPVCDLVLDDKEAEFVRAFGLLSFKPTVIYSDASHNSATSNSAPSTPSAPAPISLDPDEVCTDSLEKARMMFFYTAGREEVHAWLVEQGADAVTCAGKIHSDLARGFIKAEIVGFEDLLTVHSFQDARTRGLTRLVDRNFIIPKGTVLEIRFNI